MQFLVTSFSRGMFLEGPRRSLTTGTFYRGSAAFLSPLFVDNTAAGGLPLTPGFSGRISNTAGV